MHIGILGAGKVGTTLGTAFSKAGHVVSYGTRDTLGPVAAGADLVVLCTPYDALPAVVKAVGPLEGKVVVDATNPLLPGLALAVGHTDSGAEVLQRLLPKARVVKCFNTVGIEVMANPRVGGRAATMFLCGDDAEARATVRSLAAGLGFDAVEVGALSNARLLEPVAVLWIHLAVVERLGRRMALRLESEGPRAATRVASTPSRAVAVIGAGHIGAGLARAWAAAGHRVTFGVRAVEDAEVVALAKELGARVATPREAVADSEVVALAVPAGAVEALASTIDFTGKLVIDCTNRVAPGFRLEFGHTTSWAEEVSRALAGAKVFKSFNAQGAENLATPQYATGPATNFFCGDGVAEREVVAQLVTDVGFTPVFAGPLKNARLLEPLMVLWVTAARALGRRAMGFQVLRD